ncbi:MAG: DUF2232 domain-containing protein [Gemmatimonadota bacterium]
MPEAEGSERTWLRPLGLLGLALVLGVGQPLVLIGIPFALLAVLLPGRKFAGYLLAAVFVALLFGGASGDGLWYVERGWAIVVAGAFVAATAAWPRAGVLEKGLVSGAVAYGVSAGILVAGGGWNELERLVRARFEMGSASSLEVLGALTAAGEEVDQGLADVVARTVEVQVVVFPALMGLASLASLGVAWWLYVRVSEGPRDGLPPVGGFRFPDPLIWLLIGGVALLVLGDWSSGWGRVGTNLVVLMGGLYVLRGVGVLLHVAGRVTWPAALLVGVTAVLATPVVLAGAMAVGVTDSWFDLRSRADDVRRDGSG